MPALPDGLPPNSVSELRTDVLTGRQVIVAPLRSLRPQASVADPPLGRRDDPFLEGAEHETPGEHFALRRADSNANAPGWQVRVVPNRFPAVANSRDQVTSEHPETPSPHSCDSLLPTQPATGAHDVVIECPQTISRLLDLSLPEIACVLQAWQLRIEQLRQVPDILSVAVFRNEGFSAGASLPHCHSQIIASTALLPLLAEREQRRLQHLKDTGRDLIQDWLDAERRDGSRILRQTTDLLVLCPFASRTAWQIRLVPCRPEWFEFAHLKAAALTHMAEQLWWCVAAIEQCVGPFSFNVTLTLAPFDRSHAFRWMLDILPRTSRLAGWEMLSDTDIITTAPETAAAHLRQHLPLTPSDASDSAVSLSELQWKFAPSAAIARSSTPARQPAEREAPPLNTE